MKMPKRLKNKWVKALRSGEYGQTQGTLCDGNGNFCCLGVLEHIVLDGKVEHSPGRHTGTGYKGIPSRTFYDYADIEVDGYLTDDKTLAHLVDMNDAIKDLPSGREKPAYNFKAIADWIEENVETK